MIEDLIRDTFGASTRRGVDAFEIKLPLTN